MALGGEIPPGMLPENQAVPLDPLEMAPQRARLVLEEGFEEAELDADSEEIDQAETEEEEDGGGALAMLLLGGLALGGLVLVLSGGRR